ncbi:MAG: hypothetical protein PHF24_06160 [Syntrophomonas sp.]|nr:hypothetical protein [Syntrophomonas sp.]
MQKRIRWLTAFLFVIYLSVPGLCLQKALAAAQPLIYNIQVDSTVTAGTASHIKKQDLFWWWNLLLIL